LNIRFNRLLVGDKWDAWVHLVSKCNNPNFWEIEINGFIKIPDFGANKNFYFEYKINLLSF
jgi:hypothetical protein